MVCTKAGIKIPQALKGGSSQSSEPVFGYQSHKEGGLSILKKKKRAVQVVVHGSSRTHTD